MLANAVRMQAVWREGGTADVQFWAEGSGLLPLCPDSSCSSVQALVAADVAPCLKYFQWPSHPKCLGREQGACSTVDISCCYF